MNDISVQAMRRLSTAGGVEMLAMDLSKPLSEPEKQLIRDAFLEHHILVFRNQKLKEQVRLHGAVRRAGGPCGTPA